MGAAAVEIADFVDFKLETVNHPRLFGFGLLVIVGGVVVDLGGLGLVSVEFLGRWIFEDKHETAIVGRPGEIVDILNGVRKLLGIAAEAVQEPDLRFAVVALGKKGKELAVGTPAGMGGRVGCGGERERVAAGCWDHPNACFVFVGLESSGVDRIGDPLAIGAELGIMDAEDAEVVVDRDWARRRGRELSRSGGRDCESGEDKREAMGLHRKTPGTGMKAIAKRGV